ncbi:MAG: nucleotide exchange factor GrpE [Saprospirales bacterium]|nr:nucleotide exchange factor GrpE [Saprospirales bacterium]
MKNKRPHKTEQDAQENTAEQAKTAGTNMESTATAPEQEPTPDDLRQQLDDMRKKYMYLLSDFENFKRNTARERIELQQTAGRDIVTALLSVLDDFDRAAKNQALNEGTTLIHHKFVQILQNKGLIALQCQPGDAFDADTQEAVAEIPAPSEALKGKIVDIVDKGYQLGERIIRFAKVVVGR